MPLVLGGVALEHPRGLAGHSDGDVLAHALIDALLGAAGLGDIGWLFPSGDERLRGVSSLELLTDAYAQVRAAGWRLVNADCVLVGEEPRIAPHREEMRRRLAEAIGEGEVNVRATTTDGSGSPAAARASRPRRSRCSSEREPVSADGRATRARGSSAHVAGHADASERSDAVRESDRSSPWTTCLQAGADEVRRLDEPVAPALDASRSSARATGLGDAQRAPAAAGTSPRTGTACAAARTGGRATGSRSRAGRRRSEGCARGRRWRRDPSAPGAHSGANSCRSAPGSRRTFVSTGQHASPSAKCRTAAAV